MRGIQTADLEFLSQQINDYYGKTLEEIRLSWTTGDLIHPQDPPSCSTLLRISVRTELAADLPQIVGDRLQLQQVQLNLIVNSIRAMKDVDGTRKLTAPAWDFASAGRSLSPMAGGCGRLAPRGLAEPFT